MKLNLGSLLPITLLLLHVPVGSDGNPDAKRLYDDLLSDYNKLVRPVINVTDAVTVKFKLKLSQLIDVNLRNQIMTTNLWIEQLWNDYKLTWNPEEYGGVDILHVPSRHIWLPDIVLYNNADGNFEVTLATKATLYAEGKVEWKPPAIYHSSCEMDVEYFPFDEQTCIMKFGSWTYDGTQVDLRHRDEEINKDIVVIGIDLSEFYQSVEWDILEVPAIRNVKFYTCCDEPYLDITFNITMRRKTLFYTVNLIIPCMGISFLTVLVFYLPSDSGEKVSLSISILLSLTVFFLLLAEIIPPTSLVVPLLGKFVLFTMILDTFRRVFIHILPRLLVMRRPNSGSHGYLQDDEHELEMQEIDYDSIKRELLPILQDDKCQQLVKSHKRHNGTIYGSSNCKVHGDMYNAIPPPLTSSHHGGRDQRSPPPPPLSRHSSSRGIGGDRDRGHDSCRMGLGENGGVGGRGDGGRGPRIFSEENLCPELLQAVEGVKYIADVTRKEEESNKVKEDWKYVAMVMDRLFLWIFTIAVLVGTAGIILQAPTLYDTRPAIDPIYSGIDSTIQKPPENHDNHVIVHTN